jgi:hypothetical protein
MCGAYRCLNGVPLRRPAPGLRYSNPKTHAELLRWVDAGIIKPFNEDVTLDCVIAQALCALRERIEIFDGERDTQ